jgi:hypothetical protein
MTADRFQQRHRHQIATNDMASNNEETFEVLVRDQMNRDPRTWGIYPWVGLQEQLFVLNRSMFCERSDFFSGALEKSDSSSSETKPIILTNHKPEDFAAYKRFVETGSLDMPSDDVYNRFFPRLRLYVLADQLGDIALADRIINDIIQISDEFDHAPSKKEIWFVWLRIHEFDHPLKRLFVDYQIHEGTRESLLFKQNEHIPFDYLNAVVLTYWDLVRREEKRRVDGGDDEIFGVECSERGRCYYHQHGEDTPCALLGSGAGRSGAGNDE